MTGEGSTEWAIYSWRKTSINSRTNDLINNTINSLQTVYSPSKWRQRRRSWYRIEVLIACHSLRLSVQRIEVSLGMCKTSSCFLQFTNYNSIRLITSIIPLFLRINSVSTDGQSLGRQFSSSSSNCWVIDRQSFNYSYEIYYRNGVILRGGAMQSSKIKRIQAHTFLQLPYPRLRSNHLQAPSSVARILQLMAPFSYY